ncbi:Zinc finger protein GIS2 [Anthophora plagiata]
MVGKRRNISDLTITDLKELLRARDLAVSGSKNELIARLIVAEPNVEDAIQERLEDYPLEGAQASISMETAQSARESSAVPRTDTSLADREVEILRRERDVLQKELELMRRERVLATTPQSAESNATARATTSIRTIADLLNEFSGAGNTFRIWERQVQHLRKMYGLDDCATVTIITLRLRGKALKWFHSQPSLMELPASVLLEEIRKMFDHRVDRLAVRREFERRTWQKNEMFADYFHDKKTLANQILIDPEELLDLIIDGVPDPLIRDQARMQRLETTDELLDAFRKLSLRNDREPRDPKQPALRKFATRDTTEEKVKRCFNCNETGHWKKDCTKTRREWGSCFTCGGKTYRAKDCPQQASRMQAGQQRQVSTLAPASTLAPGTSTHLVQPGHPETPFVVPLTCTVQDSNEVTTQIAITAIIDSGSPVSLIKRGILPPKFNFTRPENNRFYGVNHSPVEIEGTLTTEVQVNNARIPLYYLHIVPDTTMSYFALLGRDFIRSPDIKIILGNSVEITADRSECRDSELNSVIGQCSAVGSRRQPLQ